MSDYWTPAHQAVEQEDAEAPARLLAFGADPELADPDGRTPMDMANHYGHYLAVKLLQAHISSRPADNR
ncbi:ankyrin repeat domain-containing protein [Streptomyces sp. bgisy032]|uniref:ankyrin repeat domain-containing protein n=1 Tax=Streptomyces sp. bgisy032 TaxID=3413773 RepID=UPI003D762647